MQMPPKRKICKESRNSRSQQPISTESDVNSPPASPKKKWTADAFKSKQVYSPTKKGQEAKANLDNDDLLEFTVTINDKFIYYAKDFNTTTRSTRMICRVSILHDGGPVKGLALFNKGTADYLQRVLIVSKSFKLMGVYMTIDKHGPVLRLKQGNMIVASPISSPPTETLMESPFQLPSGITCNHNHVMCPLISQSHTNTITNKHTYTP